MARRPLTTAAARVRQDLAIAESQLRDYQARLGKPVMLDRYLSQRTSLRDQLKADRSVAVHESGYEAGSSVSELADKIKAIKAANTIEAAPQRVRQCKRTPQPFLTGRLCWASSWSNSRSSRGE